MGKCNNFTFTDKKKHIQIHQQQIRAHSQHNPVFQIIGFAVQISDIEPHLSLMKGV